MESFSFLLREDSETLDTYKVLEYTPKTEQPMANLYKRNENAVLDLMTTHCTENEILLKAHKTVLM